MTRCILVALLATLALAAPTSAATPEQIAADLFPSNPCIGKTTQVFDPTIAPYYAVAGINSSAYALNCQIRINPTWWAKASPQRRCIMLIHEAGHQAGHPDGTGIMDHHLPTYYEPCASPRERVIHRLENKPNVANVRCGRRSGTSYRCRAELLNGRMVRYRINGNEISRV
jgi:hypothetical protein